MEKKYVNEPLQLTLLGSKRRSRILQERKLGLQKVHCQEKKSVLWKYTQPYHPIFIVKLFNSIAAVGKKCVITTVLVKVLNKGSTVLQRNNRIIKKTGTMKYYPYTRF